MKDYEIIKTQLEKLPIHLAESIARLILKKNFLKAAEYCQKFGLENLACAIKDKDGKKIEDYLSEIWCGELWDDDRKPIYGWVTNNLITINKKYLTEEYRRPIYNIEEIITSTDACRRKILENINTLN